MPTASAIREHLAELPYNSMYLQLLETQCQKEGGIVPFVGAGFSAAFGYPQWGPFLLDTTANPAFKVAIQEKLDTFNYEGAASLVREKLGWRLFEDLLRDAFEDKRLPADPLKGAVAQLPKFRPGPVVTTNFDRVIEKVFRDAGRPLMAIWHSQAVKGSEALQHNRALLLKMHGDWEDSDNRVLTNEEYEAAYGDLRPEKIDYKRPLPQLLNILLPSRSCLFLGCSLKQDRTMTMLKTIAAQYKTMHFAVVEVPEKKEEFEQRQKELSDLGICPIWYPFGERHASIEPLLEYLAVKSVSGVVKVYSTLERKEPPNNIPMPPNATVGRAEEILELTAMLSGARLVMITGAGGCGKSRVVIEVARETRFKFPEGVWYVDLADLSEKADKEELVPARIGSIAGIPQQPSRPPLEALVDHFGQGRHLLLLDNCEHLASSCAKLVVELLARCPRLQVLGTSRSALMLSEERVYPLSTLPVPEEGLDLAAIQANESVKLFKERAGARFHVNESNGDMVAALCRTLDGIPLAIEVAAARLGVQSVAQMNKESQNLMNMLAGVQVDDLRNWHTVNAALEWSYRLLTKPSRDFLRSLAVFDGGWTEQRATALYASRLKKTKSTVDLLQKLLDNSMVVSRDIKGVQRFRLLEPVRQFLKAKLTEKEIAEYGDKHAAIFAALAEESSSELLKVDQAKWLDTLQSEVDNLRAAFRWAVENKHAETALRLTAYVWRFLEIRGYFAEGRKRAEEAIGMNGADGHPELLERALSGAGWLAYRQADFADAQSLIERALDLAEANGNGAGISNALNDLGNICRIHGNYDAAREHFSRCLDMVKENPNKRMFAVVLYNLGAIALDQGDLEEASRKLAQSLDSFRDQSNKREIAFPLRSLAEIALLRGDLELARDYAGESLAIREELKDSKGRADTLCSLAWIEIRAGNPVEARAHLKESLALAKAIGDRRTLSEALEVGALVHSGEDDHAVAVQLVAGARHVRERLGFVLPPVRKKFIDEISTMAKGRMTSSEYQGFQQRGASRDSNALIDLANLRANP
jgi:predicted ATPase